MSDMTINNINDTGTTDDNMINGLNNGNRNGIGKGGMGNGDMGNSDGPVSDIR